MSTIPLLDLIDFKWLMAGEGQRVHVERLQSDPGYAEDCLRRAAQSSNEALRRCAERLRRLDALKKN
jgi:hypothetical protein